MTKIWFVLLIGLVLGFVLAAIGRRMNTRLGRALFVVGCILTGGAVFGDLISGILGYNSFYTNIRDTGFIANPYPMKVAAIILALICYLAIGEMMRRIALFQQKNAVLFLVGWLVVYWLVMFGFSSNQLFDRNGPKYSFVELSSGQIKLCDIGLAGTPDPWTGRKLMPLTQAIADKYREQQGEEKKRKQEQEEKQLRDQSQKQQEEANAKLVAAQKQEQQKALLQKQEAEKALRQSQKEQRAQQLEQQRALQKASKLEAKKDRLRKSRVDSKNSFWANNVSFKFGRCLNDGEVLTCKIWVANYSDADSSVEWKDEFAIAIDGQGKQFHSYYRSFGGMWVTRGGEICESCEYNAKILAHANMPLEVRFKVGAGAGRLIPLQILRLRILYEGQEKLMSFRHVPIVSPPPPQPTNTDGVNSTPQNTDQVRELERKVKEDPQNRFFQLGLIKLYLDFKLYDRAIFFYSELLELQPKNSLASNSLGRVYFLSKQYDKAVAQTDYSLTLDPRNIAELFNKGLYLANGKNDFMGAAESWQKVMELDPDGENGRDARQALEKITPQLKKSYFSRGSGR